VVEHLRHRDIDGLEHFYQSPDMIGVGVTDQHYIDAVHSLAAQVLKNRRSRGRLAPSMRTSNLLGSRIMALSSCPTLMKETRTVPRGEAVVRIAKRKTSNVTPIVRTICYHRCIFLSVIGVNPRSYLSHQWRTC
jgi:hypothetical protein